MIFSRLLILLTIYQVQVNYLPKSKLNSNLEQIGHLIMPCYIRKLPKKFKLTYYK